jgi:hypothetical protein
MLKKGPILVEDNYLSLNAAKKLLFYQLVII